MLPALKLKKLRARRGLSQPQLAEIIGTPVKTIQKWERSETKPSAAAMRLIELIDDDVIYERILALQI